MADKIIIRLNSTGLKKKKNPADKDKKTGYFKTTHKNGKNKEKLSKKCFDPRAWNEEKGKFGMHVIFVEGKVK